jgi:hypothetical protein
MVGGLLIWELGPAAEQPGSHAGEVRIPGGGGSVMVGGLLLWELGTAAEQPGSAAFEGDIMHQPSLCPLHSSVISQ